MKDYEKLAIAIGGGALAIAAYQAYKTKEAVDATTATDPSRNPVTAAIDLGTNVIGGTYDWFRKGFDSATGRVTGRGAEILNSIKAIPSQVGYNIMKPLDFGKEAAEAGTKYIWSLAGHIASTGKEKFDVLTNKPFTAMGGATTHVYEAARHGIPKATTQLANVLSGVGSKLEVTAETTKEKVLGYFNFVRGKFHI